MYSYGLLHMAKQKQDDQLEYTYSSYVRIWDVALKTCQKWWMIGRGGERGSGISVLVARHDDDDDDWYRNFLTAQTGFSGCVAWHSPNARYKAFQKPPSQSMLEMFPPGISSRSPCWVWNHWEDELGHNSTIANDHPKHHGCLVFIKWKEICPQNKLNYCEFFLMRLLLWMPSGTACSFKISGVLISVMMQFSTQTVQQLILDFGTEEKTWNKWNVCKRLII